MKKQRRLSYDLVSTCCQELSAKKPYIPAKEPGICTKEPCIFARESCEGSHRLGHPTCFLYKTALYLYIRALSSQEASWMRGFDPVHTLLFESRVDFLLKTDGGYPKDRGLLYSPWQALGVPFAI